MKIKLIQHCLLIIEEIVSLFYGTKSKKYVKEYEFSSRNLSNKYWKLFLNTASKKVVHKAGKFSGKKIADAVAKSNDDKIVKPKHVIDKHPRNVEEIIIPPEKRWEILSELRQVL